MEYRGRIDEVLNELMDERRKWYDPKYRCLLILNPIQAEKVRDFFNTSMQGMVKENLDGGTKVYRNHAIKLVTGATIQILTYRGDVNRAFMCMCGMQYATIISSVYFGWAYPDNRFHQGDIDHVTSYAKTRLRTTTGNYPRFITV